MKTYPFLFFLTILIAPLPVRSKKRYFNRSPNFTVHTPDRIHALEERFRPYLETRLRNRLHPHERTQTGNNSEIPYNLEIMMLARSWSSLSEEFKSLYISSIVFPDNFTVFNSPGGHFEVYYTTEGTDSVSSVDQYHYSPLSPYNRISQSNGIPDYVDETAWALDSAWRMEVDRFGFQQPYPYIDSLKSSDRYKVLIQNPGQYDEDVYGYTMFYQRIDNNSFSSYITIRNEWSNFNTEPLKYDNDPNPAIRVTCAHEFFHAIQYGMTWDFVNSSATLLDDFPLTWTEGCAVTMEELAFPDVNDYIQYTMPYFYKPAISFFSQNNTYYNQIYLQSLFLIYATTRLWDDTNAGFIREMYTNNYETIIPFKQNLTNSLSKNTLTWPLTLNKFHTASYFTGSRSDTTLFISDANDFTEWNTESSSETQSIAENSVGIFSIERQYSHYDTLFIRFQPIEAVTEQNSWAGSVILRKENSARIISLALDQDGKGSLIVPDWNSEDECIATISSGFSESTRKYNVDFTPCTIMHFSGSTDTIFGPRGSRLQPITIIHAYSDLRCDLTISRASIASNMASVALLNNIQLVDSLFSIDFPLAWKDSANITLFIDSISNELNIFRWQQDSLCWIQLSNASSNDEIIQATVSESGIYGCFKAIKSTEEKTIIAFPNPAHIYHGSGMITCEGYNINAVAIYSVSGSLVHQVSKNDLQSSTSSDTIQRFYWKLQNKQGNPLSPGVYTLVTQYSNNKKSKITKTKILLIP